MGGGSRRPDHADRVPGARALSRHRHHDAEVRRRYDRIAPAYDRRWTRYVEESAERTLARMDLAGVRDVLDVGCGTGVLLERIARTRPDIHLAGVDLSPAMLARGRQRLGSRAGLAEGSALHLPFRSATFDLVVSASALHHMADPALAIAEMRRVLRRGGRLAITDWCADGWLVRLRDRLLRRRERGYTRALRAAELAILLADAGFSDMRIDRWRIGFRWPLMTASATVPLGS